MSAQTTIPISIPILMSKIDHALLHPTLTDAQLLSGLEFAKSNKVATACIKPCHTAQAAAYLKDSGVGVCAVIGFPAGNSTTEVKVFEARKAVEDGATEIDMVINIGKARSQEWEYVENEIRQVNQAVTAGGAILKVIFENAYLDNEVIIRLCEICSKIKVAFVKTSTGYGFVQDEDGSFKATGATMLDLRLMRQHSDPAVQVKAAGGISKLDEFIAALAIGVTRVGTSRAGQLLKEAESRGIGMETTEVPVPAVGNSEASKGAY